MMLGTLSYSRNMYSGTEITLDGDLTEDLLAAAVAALPAGVFKPRAAPADPVPQQELDANAFKGVKDGAFADERRAEGSPRRHFGPANLNMTAAARVRGMMRVRDAVRDVCSSQLEDWGQTREINAPAPASTGSTTISSPHTVPSRRGKIEGVRGSDPDQPLLFSLEAFDRGNATAVKAAIFRERTLDRYKPIEHVDTAAEALSVTLNSGACSIGTGCAGLPASRKGN